MQTYFYNIKNAISFLNKVDTESIILLPLNILLCVAPALLALPSSQKYNRLL